MTILSVGIRDRSEAMKTLPLRILFADSGAEAVKNCFQEKIDVVISHWNITDMPNGELLKKVGAAKPNLPTIAFVKAGDPQQEILACSLGISVVLADDIGDEYFRQIICQILDIADGSHIESISNIHQDKLNSYL